MNYAAPMAEHMTAADKRVVAWLEKFEAALAGGDVDAATALFVDECYWRDLVSFTWNITTSEGKGQIADMLKATLARVEPSDWQLDEPANEADGVTDAWITFETDVFRGKGHLRLKGDLGWTLLTTAEELKGHEEKRGATREKSVEHGVRPDRKSWLERKEAEEAELGISRMPYCVIVGGGQGGIGLGARLKRLGVPAIIVDKHPRPGDHWRKRYKSLHLHDPVWYDHMPYLPFPDHWPVFAAKDKIGDWLESYTKVMELNYWPNTTCKSAKFDDTTKEWTIEVERDGEPLTLKAQQLVLATGLSAVPNLPQLQGHGDVRGHQPPFEPAPRRRRLARQEGGGDRLQQFRARHLRRLLRERRRRHHGPALLDAYCALGKPDGAGARWPLFGRGRQEWYDDQQG